MTRFIIVRHGHTRGTEQNRYYGRTDIPLSAYGISQMKNIKKNMDKISFDYIYTSPLRRCTRTAEILRNPKSAEIDISHDLVEIDFGDWEGLTLIQMKKKNPRKFNNWLYDFANFHMPGGESVKNMVRRTKKFWNYILNRHSKGNILIVTHGGPAKVIIMDTLGLSMKNFWRLNISTGSVSVIESFTLSVLRTPFHDPDVTSGRPGYPCQSMGRSEVPEGQVRGFVKAINLWGRLS